MTGLNYRIRLAFDGFDTYGIFIVIPKSIEKLSYHAYVTARHEAANIKQIALLRLRSAQALASR
ncbi:hypothetical protein [Winogradskyella pulchriflava]|uniref:Uncharacterized protein n=1 Tax=Winogradskyella pulchriflava TaxID=1110688 RepID=A0ABV6QB91_9FLAO